MDLSFLKPFFFFLMKFLKPTWYEIDYLFQGFCWDHVLILGMGTIYIVINPN